MLLVGASRVCNDTNSASGVGGVAEFVIIRFVL